MVNIILCGGNGTRLWPISRTLMPKQFIKLFNNRSLFQLTVERNSNLCNKQLIVSNSEQYFLANDQLIELNKINSNYLLEPIAKNTAAAIALACMSLDKNEIVLVTPSDHLIKDEDEYKKVLIQAKELATQNKLVTFGITPTNAETGYGYIEEKDLNVQAFHEKPNFETAKKYLKKGNYYWNSGMFCFKANVFLSELKKYSPEIYKTSMLAYKNSRKDNLIRIKYEDMESIPEDSIDYAVMEKSLLVKVIPSDIGWSDLGSFDSLYDELEKDENGNTINTNHISYNSKNNLIYGEERIISTIDIEDIIIVDTADALLISKKGSTQKVKQIVQEVKKKKLELHNVHLLANRPWGSYTILEDTNGFKIKKIVVKPGERLSLQKHFHRSEHWIVVRGTATVTNDDKTYIVRANESTYIKMGDYHRLANYGKIDLIVVEVQVGEYTGEDDIIRIDDDYNREGEK
ncbi:MAG: mannose-1-phosphate guanylyltransferase/mannose-6-phosphate isomerase [Arcobacteraceae bacterium]|nr:mannose-1-phosphate guanylyltransferase/mannose-6-phosphate isomerase [Arcobacteraceae bacterium]